MKLSDAIEAGWKDLEQVFGPYYAPGYYHEVGGGGYDPARTTGVCAIGAACIAVEPLEKPGNVVWRRYWPELEAVVMPTTHPQLQQYNDVSEFRSAWTVADYVTVLNDRLHLSKEEIVETVRSWGY